MKRRGRRRHDRRLSVDLDQVPIEAKVSPAPQGCAVRIA
jgi:hypothetical protein